VAPGQRSATARHAVGWASLMTSRARARPERPRERIPACVAHWSCPRHVPQSRWPGRLIAVQGDHFLAITGMNAIERKEQAWPLLRLLFPESALLDLCPGTGGFKEKEAVSADRWSGAGYMLLPSLVNLQGPTSSRNPARRESMAELTHPLLHFDPDSCFRCSLLPDSATHRGGREHSR